MGPSLLQSLKIIDVLASQHVTALPPARDSPTLGRLFAHWVIKLSAA